MKIRKPDRREFIRSSVATTAGSVLTSTLMRRTSAAGVVNTGRTNAEMRGQETGKPRIRFSAIGLNHGHINGQVDAVTRGGGQLISFYAKEPDLVAAFARRYPGARLARSEKEILEDTSIQLVVSAAIPDERAPLGIEVMRHGKDYMVDKPGITTLEQLSEVRRVQGQTRRIYSILYGERLENPATVRAGTLVRDGAVGKVIQTIGLGPHRMTPQQRPSWFFDRKRFGGILCDIGSHQFDQFLYFTASTKAEIVASQVGNVHYPQHPGFEDFGDAMMRGNGGAGYIRVDWFTPDGLNTWGDGRLTILGTEGYIEIRKNVDIAGQPGGSHLFLVDKKSTRRFDCSKEPLPYGDRLVDDILNRTETAMSQEHCFLAMELALKAQKSAQQMNLKK